MQDGEERSIATGRGKWCRSGVPHAGWRCVDIEDLGKPQLRCQMCESQTIRFVHYMEHPTYVEVLAVGCICAGHMEGDPAGACSREAAMKRRHAKRQRWLSRKWRLSMKGNLWLRADGFRVTVYKRGNGWSVTVCSDDDSMINHNRRIFMAQEHAQLAGFDLITKALSDNQTKSHSLLRNSGI